MADEQEVGGYDQAAADALTQAETGAPEAEVETDAGGGATAGEQAPEGVEAQPEEGFTDPNKIPPELMPAYKSMQADYTKKTQAIAEQARQLQWVDQMRELATNDPAEAARVLRAQADYLAPQTPSGPSNGEEVEQIEWEMESPATRQLASAVVEMAKMMQGIRGNVDQTVQFTTQERFSRELAAIKEEFGVELAPEQLKEAARAHPGIGLREAYVLANFAALQDDAKQKALGNKDFKRKVSDRSPAGSRAAATQQPGTYDEAIELALHEIGAK